MKEIAIDFYRPMRMTVGGSLLLITGLAALFASSLGYQAISTQVQALETGRETASRQMKSKATVLAPTPIDRDNLKRIALARADLVLPWEQLFGALERSRLDSVALLSVEPDPRSSTVRISAATNEYESAVAYVERLSNREFLKDVVLASHTTDRGDPALPVRFVVEAHWKPS